jgi:hypothetical protein
MFKNEIASAWLLAGLAIALIGVGGQFPTNELPIAPAGQVNVRAPSIGIAPQARGDILDDMNFLRAERATSF